FGKTFHATGWKIGYCVGAEKLVAEFKNIHQWNVFSVNSFVQYALAEHLQDASAYERLPRFFQQKRDLLTQALASLPMQANVSAGTYFQLYSYEGLSDLNEFDFAKYLTQEVGVAVIPLSPFYSNPPNEKVIRLCFGKKAATLVAAAERLNKHF
ncbi:MAG: aminotransferase class I/II-fold pyridoxal phosphate-dependent enzyme, partial [Bacteroidota bacterium]